MDSQVIEVKSKTDIVSIIGERIELKKAGRNYKANCPFHGEKTASFMVSPEIQIFKCFGCGESGDAFSFLEKYEGMEFPEALKYLADRAGVKLLRKNFGPTSDRERLIEIHVQAKMFYSYMLLKHSTGKRALDYLINNRGLKMETIKEFEIGYAPENSYLINDFLVKNKKFFVKDVCEAGIGVSKDNKIFYDRFNGRVIFPLFDHRGNAIGFSGRVLPWDKRDTGKYINSPETPTYHKSSVLYGLNVTRQFIKKKKVAIVVEGELDLISTYAAGIKNVVAIKGSALTDEQVKLLSRFAPKFILALDSDFAGDAAARRGVTIAENLGVEVKIAEISKYKDPDEAVRSDLESYKKDLIKARGVWDFLIDSVFNRFNGSTGEGKAKISKELIPILAGIEDKIVQSHYANLVAEKLRVPLSAVSDQISKFDKGEVQVDQKNDILEKKTGREDLLENRFIILAFQYDPKTLLEKQNSELIKNPVYKKILEVLRDYLQSKKSFDASEFGRLLPKELFDGYSAMVFGENQEFSEKPDELKKELDLVKKELKILEVKEKLKVLAVKMLELEKNGDKDGLLSVQNEFSFLTKNLASLDVEGDSGVIFD